MWENLTQARKETADYIDTYHRRPHSGIGYRTLNEVAATWRPDPDHIRTLGELTDQRRGGPRHGEP